MARISELHYSNAYAQTSGVSEFLEISLASSEDPADFTVSFYQHTGYVGVEITLDHPSVQVTTDPETGEVAYVISADDFPILLTDPDGGGSNNYEAYALTNTATGSVIDFYDIGGGTTEIEALDGHALGATSTNLPVLVGPNATTTTLQFNQPDPTTLTYGTVGPGDTGIACFVAGSLIDTPDGPRAIETLRPGDLVLTLDHGPQPLRWIGATTVPGMGRHAPIRISAGTLGATRPLEVSPQHRMLIDGWQAELFFGMEEVLAPATALINADTIRRAPRPQVTYLHMMFDRHQVVTAHGVPSESFFPGAQALDNLCAATRAELLTLFPEMHSYGATARPVQHSPALRLLSL